MNISVVALLLYYLELIICVHKLVFSEEFKGTYMEIWGLFLLWFPSFRTVTVQYPVTLASLNSLNPQFGKTMAFFMNVLMKFLLLHHMDCGMPLKSKAISKANLTQSSSLLPRS